MGSSNAGMRLLAVYFWLSALGATACNHMQVLPEAKPQPSPSVQNLCQSLPYDCHQEGTMPCQSQADCACLGDFCAGVTDSIFPTATDPSKIDCCDGFCVNFAVSPLQDCSELASSGISCPFTGAPAQECGQGSDCQAITGVPGFYNCEIFCCVTRLPERVGEGQACVDNPLVEPQCDFGMKCESGSCVKICGDDPSG